MKYRTIYAYTTRSYNEERKNLGKTPWFKVGDTERFNADDRINQQDSTSNPESLDKKFETQVPYHIRDYQIHEVLKREFKVPPVRSDAKREWFECDLYTIKKAVNKVKYGVKGTKDFKMRDEQKEAHDKITNYFSNGGTEFLLAAKMRFGKNFTILNSIKTLGFKNVLVITYKPHVFNSLKDDIKEHVNFKGWNFIDFKKEREIHQDNQNVNIYASSAQLSLHKEKPDIDSDFKEIRKNLEKISQIKFDLIIADEYHYGTGSENFQELLNQISYNHIIYVSGTAMKDLAMGRFDDEQIFTWTYIDEQKKKQEGSPSHQDMPTMKMYMMDVADEAKELMEVYDEEEGFTMSKMIEDPSNEASLERFLAQLIGNKDRKEMSPFSYQSRLKHTFWVLPKNVNAIQRMARLMRSMSEYSEYHIIEATGDNVKSIDKVKDAINKYDRTITLSCYRFKEGVTVPEWNGVFMLDDGKSPQEYLQAIFRAQSPNKEENKQYCHIFDFNPQRSLLMIYEAAENNANKTQSTSESVSEFLECAHVVQHHDNKMIEVDTNEIMENFREHGSWAEKFRNIKNIHKDSLDESIINSVLGITPSRGEKRTILNDNEVGGGKNKDSKRNSRSYEELTTEKEKRKMEKRAIEKIQTALSAVPFFLFNSEDEEETVEDILNTKEKELFEEVTQVSIDTFKMWLDKGVVDELNMKRNVENFLSDERELLRNVTLENFENFITQHFTLQGKETSTPKDLVLEMLDKLPKEVWKDKYKKFCDPCMGTGKFLLAIKEKLMEGLKDEIEVENEREKWIIENMLYGCDIQRSKTFVARKIINTNNYSHNLMTEDSLKLNWENMPKFDVVVGNPPYKQGMHIKFTELAYNISKQWMVWIHPSGWLIDEKNRKKDYQKLKELLKENIKEIKLFNGNHLFNVGLFVPFAIDVINKDYSNNGKIKVKDETNNKDIIYKDINEINKFGNNKEYISLKNKILNLSKKDNLENHKNEKNDKKYYINLSLIRGNVSVKNNDKMFNDDFYSFFPNNIKIEDKINRRKYGEHTDFFFSFNTQYEAKNFIKFLKTRWAMFALSIYKTSQNLNRKEIEAVPWLDWTQEWTERKFEKYIGASEEEINFVLNNIPNYYNVNRN